MLEGYSLIDKYLLIKLSFTLHTLLYFWVVEVFYQMSHVVGVFYVQFYNEVLYNIPLISATLSYDNNYII
ncbi:unnamed protein product [Trifolium pratense]|uniref:Uncharacterized protein n=1 Tax=Trifolium pratense TaxID=57577 RepID=A0ACB0J8C6_TRIPR|nr:unnamed protein product [Trifolium pratense]